jgi:hypothetical protein
VANAYNKLPESDRQHAVIFGQNYGEAGAVDFLGRKYHLPRAISGHNNYWLWGPGIVDSGTIVIIIGGLREDHLRSFEEVDTADTVRSDYAMPYENNLPVFICRKLKLHVRDAWARIRNYS